MLVLDISLSYMTCYENSTWYNQLCAKLVLRLEIPYQLIDKIENLKLVKYSIISELIFTLYFTLHAKHVEDIVRKILM